MVVLGIDRRIVLREMSGEDIQAAFKAYELKQREGWEQTRIIAYNVVAPHMKRPIPVKSFMPLPWEKKISEAKPPSREDFERLKKRFNLK